MMPHTEPVSITERCFVHPPRMMCDQCGSLVDGGITLNEPQNWREKKEIDAAWKTMSEVESELFRECFDFYKNSEKRRGQAASLALEDVEEFRELLVSLEGELEYEPGRTFLERVAEIEYSRRNNRLLGYWQGWKP